MFTGIIEEIGTISRIISGGKSMVLQINARKVCEDIKLGDSIAVNGVCLTVVGFNSRGFSADVMPVTFRDTNLATLRNGSAVNLERAMAANGRFGGHIVSGHVDGVGTISSITPTENALVYRITLAAELLAQCVLKGSIAIDGTSLTIAAIANNYLEVALIPHTRKESVLGIKKIGNTVNIECDMLLKQNIKVAQANSSRISADFLRENGFL